ncbi:MAG: lipid-A-disaccharide synthase [Planctomycetota bacterium]
MFPRKDGPLTDSNQPGILFTAFEPSGDAHAAPVIRRLLEKIPQLRIYAWGGEQMQEAGATIVEHTADDAAMGLNALSKVMAVRREVKRIKRWSKAYRVLAHVAVDSPAANFPICKIMRKSGARVVHLVAPQLWAWGGWRAKKLRNRTDLVLCLLPFEEQWFGERDIPARFIGHPRMNRPVDVDELREQMHGMPQGAPHIALFPGSRMHEVSANIRLLVKAFAEIQGRHAGTAGLIVAARPEIAKLIRKKVKVLPNALHMITGLVDPAICWADLCLAVSGTVSLDIARQQKPMIGVYKTGVIAWLGAKVLLRTPFRLLPNIIAEREICPEFVPHCGGPMPIVREAYDYIQDSKNAAIATQELARVCQRFSNKRPSEEAARLIMKVIKDGKI